MEKPETAKRGLSRDTAMEAHLGVETLREHVGELKVEPPAADRRVPTLPSDRHLSHVSVLDLLGPERNNGNLGKEKKHTSKIPTDI